MGKGIKKLLIVLIILAGVVMAKDMIIKTVVTNVGSSMIGAPLRIGHFSLALVSQKIRIKNLKLYNPPGYPKEPLIDIPEVSVDYDLPALLKGKLHLRLVVVNMKEMTVIKDKDGKLNVDSLKVVQTKDKPKEQVKSKTMPMQIDRLKLTAGQVVLKDYTKGNPSVEVFEVGIKNKEYRNITSAQYLVTLIMAETLGRTAIKSATIYATAAILGAGLLPVGVVNMLVGKDSAVQEFNSSYDQVFDGAVGLLKEMGSLVAEDRSSGMLKGNIDGAEVIVRIEKAPSSTHVTTSARKMLIPKPEIAAGIQRQLAERLK